MLRRRKDETNGLRRLTADQFRPRRPGRFRDRVIVRVSGRRHLQYRRALTRCDGGFRFRAQAYKQAKIPA